MKTRDNARTNRFGFVTPDLLSEDNDFNTKDHADKNEIRIFPNPTRSTFNIENSTGQDGRAVKIYTQSGTLVYSHSGKIRRSFRVEKELEPGVYLVEIQFESRSVIRKLVVI